jgi:hypothetical protein
MPKRILQLVAFLLAVVSQGLSGAEVGDSPAKYQLVQAQIGDEVPQRGPVASATVYVLICPDQRLYVFRACYSHQMEEVIKHFPRGGVLQYKGNALIAQPSEAQMRALVDSCKSKGIVFDLAPTN